MIAIIKKRFLTSFGMTGSWGESTGKSGDSLLTRKKNGKNSGESPLFPTYLN